MERDKSIETFVRFIYFLLVSLLFDPRTWPASGGPRQTLVVFNHRDHLRSYRDPCKGSAGKMEGIFALFDLAPTCHTVTQPCSTLDSSGRLSKQLMIISWQIVVSAGLNFWGKCPEWQAGLYWCVNKWPHLRVIPPRYASSWGATYSACYISSWWRRLTHFFHGSLRILWKLLGTPSEIIGLMMFILHS